MKQKTRFKNFGYQSVNDQYISIGPQKAISVDLYRPIAKVLVF